MLFATKLFHQIIQDHSKKAWPHGHAWPLFMARVGQLVILGTARKAPAPLHCAVASSRCAGRPQRMASVVQGFFTATFPGVTEGSFTVLHTMRVLPWNLLAMSREAISQASRLHRQGGPCRAPAKRRHQEPGRPSMDEQSILHQGQDQTSFKHIVNHLKRVQPKPYHATLRLDLVSLLKFGHARICTGDVAGRLYHSVTLRLCKENEQAGCPCAFRWTTR